MAIQVATTCLDDERVLRQLAVHPVGSRVIQAVLERRYALHENLLSTPQQVASLSGDPAGMRVVATAVKVSPDGEPFKALWKRVKKCLPDIIAARHFIIPLAALQRSNPPEEKVLKDLTSFFHGMLSAEYYGLPHLLLASDLFIHPVSGIRFGPQLLMFFLDDTGMASVPSDTIRSVANTPDGSRVLQHYITTVASAENTTRFIRRFRKRLTDLALNEYGSRLLEVLFDAADGETRGWMEGELSEGDNLRRLRGHEIGRILIGKYKWEHKKYRGGKE